MALMEARSAGEALEMHVIVFFSGVFLALIFLFFAGREHAKKREDNKTKTEQKPKKTWKNFCKTK